VNAGKFTPTLLRPQPQQQDHGREVESAEHLEEPRQEHRHERAKKHRNREHQPTGNGPLPLPFALAWIGVRAPSFMRLHRPTTLSQRSYTSPAKTMRRA
jgi:hypothetical protein